ncbi:amidohydrolase [uncultured Holdemania sp.]|uniref:amidohydrolase n=1 Tax=uncultured Holdemania sp. TaxID=527664 RepID=UPI0028052844|nr:amidohydrolase [uncultured Holdemania sp.]
MICIKNGWVHDAVHEEPYIADILADKGKITAIGQNLIVPQDCEIIDATDKNIYPGFVEAHCHIGLDGSGIGFEGDDCNEMTDILTPQLRAIDGINPMDPTFREAALAGITTVCTGPGSANVLGGTFTAIKTVGKRVDKMIVKKEVAMKCAFGENPKRCYKDKNNYSRMSTASKLREMLLKAREYDRKVLAAGSDESKLPAYDMKLEALRPVLHGELPLKAHAHQANDIFTALRIAHEFNVKITLEHVTEGHLIVDELKDEPVPMAVGPSLTHASKFELRNKTFETPGILANAGCQVSIITDSPVIPQQYLPLCAGLAIKSGMKEWDALKAITINAAKHIGIEDRVGSLEIGKDADILIMEGSCFEVSAQPEIVIIDGKVVA